MRADPAVGGLQTTLTLQRHQRRSVHRTQASCAGVREDSRWDGAAATVVHGLYQRHAAAL
jgi:hypothetical protein